METNRIIWPTYNDPAYILTGSHETAIGHMVTVVTVTAFICRILGHAGETLRFAGRKPKGNREKNGTFLSFAYTQMMVCLYANYRSSILKLKRISKR